MHNGFFRIAAAVNKVRPGDCTLNALNIIQILHSHCGVDSGVDVVVFPEMCVTGYTCADLFHSAELLEAADEAVKQICETTQNIESLVVVGAPVSNGTTLFNCAIAIYKGKVVATVPKTYIPNYNEFYEKRWWASAATCSDCKTTIIRKYGVGIAIEICEDLWAPIPPSTHAAMLGAEVVLNLSASDDLIGKYDYLLSLIAGQSARCICAYAYASAGCGESSTDLVFDGKAIIADCGKIIARNSRWQTQNQISIADIDIHAIRHNRLTVNTFNDCKAIESANHEVKVIDLGTSPNQPSSHQLLRTVNPHPFVPSDKNSRAKRCEEILNIQTAGLRTRLEAISCKSAVIGISGGLDSTLALLVTCRAFDSLSLPRTAITAITMPGFGTTDRTYENALTLMRSLGVTIREIPIAKAVNQHFEDIGHNPENHDVTYENSQARERTQILMDVANQVGGIVIGTGDMSELALGWATYNGDHMSMYGVNAGVPKTLVRYLVEQYALTTSNPTTAEVLRDIIDTPISPELIPAGPDGKISQITENFVGPYELNDFFLYHTLRYGASPKHIYYLAYQAFCADYTPAPVCSHPVSEYAGTRYTPEELKKHITTFFRRFFSQQFKRSCMPDGPKVGSVCLSPRGDWRMPSDASAHQWLLQCQNL